MRPAGDADAKQISGAVNLDVWNRLRALLSDVHIQVQSGKGLGQRAFGASLDD